MYSVVRLKSTLSFPLGTVLYTLPNKQAFQSSLYPHSRNHICLVHFSPFLSVFLISYDVCVFLSFSGELYSTKQTTKKKTQNKKLVSLSKQRAGWQLRTHRPMLPLAMYLEDSNCSVNTHGIMLSG